MKLLQQLLNEMGADTLKSITLIPDSCCYLKSVKSVVDFSPERIVLKVGKSSVTVEGNDMTLGEFFEGDLIIKGGVKGVKID